MCRIGRAGSGPPGRRGSTATATLLLHDGNPVGTAQKAGDQLPAVLTALANLRTQPQALGHFLLAVPDEVLRRFGVILAEMARSG